MPEEPPDWKTVVEQIRDGDPAGEETLYRSLETGARIFLRRRLGTEDVEDQVHDLFLIVVESIRRGMIREPERLMAFVRTVLYRQLNLQIARLVHTRQTAAELESAIPLKGTSSNPEQVAARQEMVEIMKRALRSMSDRDFEILTRCYLHEQPPDQVRLEMGLTQTQFNLLKSRAKARLTELIRRKLARDGFSRQ
jgi:RNA polymerase sigma factor (sigma-70 family)